MDGDDCDKALADLRSYLDGECPEDIESIIATHLEACPGCMERADFEQALKAMIAESCTEVAPEGLVDRVMESLRASDTEL
jgi:anti-sigma factor (TIGR02949 family)